MIFASLFRYCTAFTVLKVSKGCRRKYFHEGFRVCVWCGGGGGGGSNASGTSSSSSNGRSKETSPTTASSCQLDRRSLRGIGRWELRGSTAEGLKHCHGKWIADDAELLEEEEEEEEDFDDGDNEYAEEETVEYCRTSAKCRDRPIWYFL
uniref:Uncharacterized protein n=1 Tax=Trichogramma kaykai TaxID=54128 RepID=A0ABD2XC27_9HYME